MPRYRAAVSSYPYGIYRGRGCGLSVLDTKGHRKGVVFALAGVLRHFWRRKTTHFESDTRGQCRVQASRRDRRLAQVQIVSLAGVRRQVVPTVEGLHPHAELEPAFCIRRHRETPGCDTKLELERAARADLVQSGWVRFPAIEFFFDARVHMRDGRFNVLGHRAIAGQVPCR